VLRQMRLPRGSIRYFFGDSGEGEEDQHLLSGGAGSREPERRGEVSIRCRIDSSYLLDGALTKIAFGIEAWTPLFASTSSVMERSAATLDSM
jgi:hypothetical protein